MARPAVSEGSGAWQSLMRPALAAPRPAPRAAPPGSPVDDPSRFHNHRLATGHGPARHVCEARRPAGGLGSAGGGTGLLGDTERSAALPPRDPASVIGSLLFAKLDARRVV